MFNLELKIKEIKDFPGYYVDIYGNIYRKLKDGRFKKLKSFIFSYRYNHICIKKDGKSYIEKISHLVLETFVGPKPEGMIACHGIKGNLNDSLENLSWGTYSKNNGIDKVRDGTSSSKLTEIEIQQIKLVKDKFTQEELGKLFNVSHSTISRILKIK